jgi:3-hydroxyisobutyrate dehydrogenase-like beta-hydroxyacid dehydrogenase
MATAIAGAGYSLQTWERGPRSADALAGVPHVRHETVKELAVASNIVALCVSTDEDVLALVTEGGLLDGLHPGSVIVNHGTGTPSTAVRLAEVCASADVEILDAPVTGGPAAAAVGTLTTMVGGPDTALRTCEPIFWTFSTHVFHLGGPGSGQRAKLFNNMLLAMNLANIADVLGIAIRLGEDPVRLTEVFATGSGASAALAQLPVNRTIDSDAPESLSRQQYLLLDMELFDTAMVEAGIDATAITERGRDGAIGVLDLVRALNRT